MSWADDTDDMPEEPVKPTGGFRWKSPPKASQPVEPGYDNARGPSPPRQQGREEYRDREGGNRRRDHDDEHPRDEYRREGGRDREYDNRDRDYDRPPRRDREERREREPRPPRDPLPLPTQPPYTAYVGNLSFEVNEPDIELLFEGCRITNIRLVIDKPTNRPKGFGYVTFEDLDSLKTALSKSNEEFMGRAVRVDVAEAREERPPARSNRDNWGEGRREGRRDNFGGSWGNRDDRRESYDRRDDRRGDDRRDPYDRRDDRRDSYDRRDDRRDSNDRRDSREEASRPKLNLAPRTLPVENPPLSASGSLSASGDVKPLSASTEAAKPKVNPFGEGRPHDELEWRRRQEEREKERLDREKDRQEKEKREQDEKKASLQKPRSDDRREAPREQRGRDASRDDKDREPREPRRFQHDDRDTKRYDDRPPRRDDDRAPRRDNDRPPRRDDDRPPRRDDDRAPRRDDDRAPRRDNTSRDNRDLRNNGDRNTRGGFDRDDRKDRPTFNKKPDSKPDARAVPKEEKKPEPAKTQAARPAGPTADDQKKKQQQKKTAANAFSALSLNEDD